MSDSRGPSGRPARQVPELVEYAADPNADLLPWEVRKGLVLPFVLTLLLPLAHPVGVLRQLSRRAHKPFHRSLLFVALVAAISPVVAALMDASCPLLYLLVRYGLTSVPHLLDVTLAVLGQKLRSPGSELFSLWWYELRLLVFVAGAIVGLACFMPSGKALAGWRSAAALAAWFWFPVFLAERLLFHAAFVFSFVCAGLILVLSYLELGYLPLLMLVLAIKVFGVSYPRAALAAGSAFVAAWLTGDLAWCVWHLVLMHFLSA